MIRASVDNDALFCALVLAPAAVSRNRFFWLFERPEAKPKRTRARRVTPTDDGAETAPEADADGDAPKRVRRTRKTQQPPETEAA